jgi:hypothetical protein
MIDKSCGMYSLYCDVCGNEEGEQFFEFYEAVDYKKENGWKSQKRNGSWEDVCPDCQKC